jgi:hypothetical protein
LLRPAAAFPELFKFICVNFQLHLRVSVGSITS